MSDWYEQYKAKVKKQAEALIESKEIGQNILYLKASGIEKLVGTNENFYTIKTNTQFGISEHLVNQLMQWAFDAGARDIDKKSYETGRAQMWSDVLKKLDIEENEQNSL